MKKEGDGNGGEGRGERGGGKREVFGMDISAAVFVGQGDSPHIETAILCSNLKYL